MTMPEGPDFSGFASSYSSARPAYPPELFSWLASVAPSRALAWDAATGSGQAAVGLAEHFDHVIATDRSDEQIRHAKAHPRVEYRTARAEDSVLEAHTVDLVAIAAALHWLDRPRFYEEACRVARDGAVLAAWTYHVAHIEPPFDEILWPFYRDVVQAYFMAGARLVDDRYAAIELPGAPLDPPALVMTARWTASDLLDFVRTWSGVQAYIEQTGEDPVERLVEPANELCGDSAHEVRWPLVIKASRLGGKVRNR